MCLSVDYVNKLERLCKLINLQATGTPQEIARKLGVSKRTIFRMIEDISTFECRVVYNKIKKTYMCEEGKRILCKFELKMIDKSDLDTLKGGQAKQIFL